VVEVEAERITWTKWLALEKEFTENYPKDKEVLEGPEWDALLEKMPRPWDYHLPETLTKESLEEFVEVLEWIGNDDPETSHSLEDRVKNMFICAVADGTFTPEETREMANILKEISQIPFSRWCA
jgi:Rad3-related DNA helicase